MDDDGKTVSVAGREHRQKIPSAHIRQVDVEQDEAWPQRMRELQALSASCREFDLKAEASEGTAREFPRPPLVFNQKPDPPRPLSRRCVGIDTRERRCCGELRRQAQCEYRTL